ncbi:thyroid receptor-interacting protein 11-like isoform X2 [Pseudomyrmex gracilis]|nr:thyroid receptor-interacting protein 11-like isoform X2 [Pseudomyrmex gracilis]XP_020300559.1 thyroid receptor-interacting protein 11-like isoform X2 [Pseudomyrmex gracilis]
MKVRELECELKRTQKVNNTTMKDDIPDGHQKAEIVRAKQDMMNRIIQMEEKTREAERNAKHIQLDEASLINDFRSVISELNSREKFDLVSGALIKALQMESETREKLKNHEKSYEELGKVDDFEYDRLLASKNHFDSQQQSKSSDGEFLTEKEKTLQRRIEELETENKDLSDAMEKLDEEHSQSVEKLLSLKEEINKKHRSLQNAYEQLSLDYNEAQKIIIELNDELKRNKNARVELSCQFVQTDDVDRSDKYTQMIVPSREDGAISETNVFDDVAQKVKAILKNYTINTVETGDSNLFEVVAKQYVDARWKLDVLERKVTELTRDLKESEEIKDSLHMECEELQSHIDSLLLENQALKSNLPSIPEASEERVASLEIDVETLREQVKHLSAENETIRETNSTLLATQRKEISLTNNLLREDTNDETAEQREDRSVSLERDKRSNENTVSIEQLKLDHEILKQELNLSLAKTEVLQNNLATLQDAVNKLTEENKDLSQRNEYLDTQLHNILQETQKKDDYLNNLQRQLDTINREKFDLENDILHKEKELDVLQTTLDAKQLQITKLSQDNDRFIKENISLSEQLTATHDESLDKIELLNTEMSLLQQEHEDSMKETLLYKEETARLMEKLRETQEHCTKLENKYRLLKMHSDRFETEKENAIELFKKDIQLSELREDFADISSANTDKTTKNETEELSTGCDDTLVGTSDLVKHLEKDVEKRDLNTTTNILSNDNNQSAVKSNADDEKLEKKVLRADNETLKAEIVHLQKQLQIADESHMESAEMGKVTIEDLSELVRKKDEEINVLQAGITHANNVIAQTSNVFISLQNEKTRLEQLVSVKNNEIVQHQSEIKQLVERVSEQNLQIEKLEFELAARNYDRAEADQAIDHSKQNKEIDTLTKKCDALEAALMLEQSNNRILQNQLTESQNKETNSAKELERLRTHLVEVESSYTEEALIAEKNREELEARLLQAEEKIKNNSTAFTSANIRANQQVETLQHQVALITQQRDQIQSKLFAAEDTILLQSASLTNLQIVLEQFQQDKERDIMSSTERIRSQLNESYKKHDDLLNEISNLKQQLHESKEYLQAASRLSEQLEKKDAQIERLNEEVAQLTASLNSADQRMKEAIEHDERRVDKTLIKNLLLGYLSSTTSDKSSILRVFANVLDFTESEKDKTGLNNNGAGQNSRLLRANKDGSSKDQEASLSTAFVRFLESESKPKPQLPALPIVNSSTSRAGINKQQPSPAQSTLLLSNVALPTFPDFVPARNTGSILKEVLKDS